MNFTLTLSRWHNVAERLNTALKEREANVKQAFTATTISPWNRERVEEKAAVLARRAAEDLAMFEAGVGTVAAIRSALARRNADLGVAAKLAEVESAKRRATLYRAVLDGQKVDMVRPENVRSLPAELIGEDDSWGLRRRTAAGVTLQVADDGLTESLRERLIQEQGRATRLLDEVADLNREKLELHVPEDVAVLAGLAG